MTHQSFIDRVQELERRADIQYRAQEARWCRVSTWCQADIEESTCSQVDAAISDWCQLSINLLPRLQQQVHTIASTWCQVYDKFMPGWCRDTVASTCCHGFGNKSIEDQNTVHQQTATDYRQTACNIIWNSSCEQQYLENSNEQQHWQEHHDKACDEPRDPVYAVA